MKPIITSLLDTDFYKLTMAQAVFHQYPDAQVEYRFINRTGVKFPDNFDKILAKHIGQLSQISLQPIEKAFLENSCQNYLSPDFIDWFFHYSFNPEDLEIHQTSGDLAVSIKGTWVDSIFWETPLLALITELYYQTKKITPSIDWKKSTKVKAELFEKNAIKYADFGTRRRFSREVHEQLIPILITHSPKSFIGTSNVALAMKHDIKPIGTFAHEWVMGHAGLFELRTANVRALDAWLKEYQGTLSIAVTDTFTTEDFLTVFDYSFASKYSGVRHDSGDPVKFIDSIVNHYIKLGIDPKEKTIVFSNNINADSAVEVASYAKDKIKVLFGIGGFLTNDVGIPRFDIVIKMTSINGQAVYKLSDDPYKSTKTL